MIAYLIAISALSVSVLQSEFVDSDLFQWIPEEGKLTLCQKQMAAYFAASLRNETWVHRMMDASSRLNSGLMSGNLRSWGDFDECIYTEQQTKAGKIKGKYCLYGLQFFNAEPIKMDHESRKRAFESPIIPADFANKSSRITIGEHIIKIPYTKSVCIPDACKPSDLEKYLKNVKYLVTFNDDYCSTIDTWTGLDGYDIGMIVVLSIILLLVITSTAYDVIMYIKQEEPHTEILIAFSLMTNCKKLIKISRNPDSISCIEGIRALSMMWVVFGHRLYFHILFSPTTNEFELWNWMNRFYAFYLFAALFAVDSFFFLGGTLLAYVFLRSMSRPKARFNVIQFYVHRYLRLTPALLMIGLVNMSLIRHLYNGPTYVYNLESYRKDCVDYWWSMLLYVQNYVNRGNNCIPQSWYLSVDTQLFVLSPLILIPLRKYQKITLYVLGVLVAVSIAIPFGIIYRKDIVPFSADFSDYYYNDTYTRATPWLIGLIFGTLLYKHINTKITMSWFVYITVWILVLFGMLTTAYFGNTIKMRYSTISTAFYLTFSKAAWAVGLSWIVFACVKGYGGPVNWFLSLPVFQILARLSYSMYLLHITIIVFSGAVARTIPYFSDFNEIHDACADVIFTVFAAFVWVLLFESPIVAIQRVLMKKNKRSAKEVTNKVDQVPSTETKDTKFV